MDLKKVFEIFNRAIIFYHSEDSIHQTCVNPYQESSIENVLFYKSWIDSVQWHCEDEVRNPQITGEDVRLFKNKIDALNQTRTNLVEQLDDYFLEKYKDVNYLSDARLNTESPAWAIDRLSILALKIYHMERELERNDITLTQRSIYSNKLDLLLTQKLDLINAIENLMTEIKQGKTIFKVYRQVKMYNDNDLNPILRRNNK